MLPQIGTLKRSYAAVQKLVRQLSAAGRSVARRREETEALLAALARSSQEHVTGPVLYDGTFDNPNFWLRASLLRAALGLRNGREVGVIGPYSRAAVRKTFTRLGMSEVFDITTPSRQCRSVEEVAESLLRSTTSPDDVLAWKLPESVPTEIVYDAILKRQRRATIDPSHPEMRSLTHEALARIVRVREILDDVRPALVVMSHTIGMVCGPLAWQAAARGIPVVLVFGLFGALRFARFTDADEIFAFYDRPTRAEIDALSPRKAAALTRIGREYLAGRFGGRADDLASVFAYQKNRGAIDRGGICEQYGWDPSRPIVAFYASNWFDWPHQLGMTQFRDFLDWTEATYGVAKACTDFNWLFKPHPAEDWFGGVALAEIVKHMGSAPNVRVSDRSWNNTHVMNAVDALVTYHGTAGIEFASLGKPVLVPDRGKYDDCGFVRVASSRAEYLSLLAQPWWRDIDLEDVQRRADVFAGWWFCAPAWQGRFVLADDSRQDALYDSIPALLYGNPDAVDRELETLRAWWASGHRYYHTWKMSCAESYQLGNV